ncbi:hypothetical protein [Wolbachia endosymbiont of Cantharis cryptica]|uniref:hypothetical protein n=1 Tax=Wolbachia endosymbiont of Cantharis cryptica TaxID=3066132 RepID=UPI00376F0226
MLFELEKEGVPAGGACSGASNVVTARVKIGSKTTLSLPTTSYVITDDPGDQRLVIINYSNRKGVWSEVLDYLSQRPQLKLERVGNDYKLALVTDSDGPYYYYYDRSDRSRDGTIFNNIATIGRIPSKKINDQYVLTYNHKRCKIGYRLLENSKVLIDPKDIISSKNISLILENLETSPNNRLTIRTGKKFFQGSQFVYSSYQSVEVYDSTGNKVGMLNNVVPMFRGDFQLFPFHEIESLKNSYFTVKKLDKELDNKLDDQYVGCISNENSECKK